MALSVLTDAATTNDSRTLSWTIPTLVTGDVAVVGVVTWDGANTMNVPSGTGLSFTQRVVVSNGFGVRVYLWTATASSGGSSVAVTSSVLAGGSSMHTGFLLLCPTADGYSLAGTPNTLSVGAAGNGVDGATVTGSLTGTSGNLAVIAVGDVNGSDWTGHAGLWTPSGTETYYARSAGDSTQAGAYATLTSGSTTVGVTGIPSGATSRLAAVEVLYSPIDPDPGWGHYVLEDASGNYELEGTTDDYLLDTAESDPGGTTATAESSASTGAANNAAPSVRPSAAASSSTAVAAQPTTTVKPAAGNPSSTAVAQQPTTTVRPNSATATAAAAALDATVSTAVATNASAECATATGTAQQPAPSVAPSAAAATSTGAANDPAVSVRATAEPASATGTAQQPTLQTGASDSADAEVAAASGVAHAAAPSVRPSAAPATATGAAQQPAASVRVNAECATASGTAAGVGAGVAVGAGASVATAASLSMTANIHASATLAEVLAAAGDPTVDAGPPATGLIREPPATSPGAVVNPTTGAAGGQVGEAQPGTPGQVVAAPARGAVGSLR